MEGCNFAAITFNHDPELLQDKAFDRGITEKIRTDSGIKTSLLIGEGTGTSQNIHFLEHCNSCSLNSIVKLTGLLPLTALHFSESPVQVCNAFYLPWTSVQFSRVPSLAKRFITLDSISLFLGESGVIFLHIIHFTCPGQTSNFLKSKYFTCPSNFLNRQSDYNHILKYAMLLGSEDNQYKVMFRQPLS